MKEYKYWSTGDIIRVFATLAVLFIHITQYSLRNSTSLDIAWWSLNIGQSLSIWAVPAFIMLSGALLLSPQSFDETPIVFYKKRLFKIGIPLLFWGIVYFLLEQKWHLYSFEYMLNDLWHGNISDHLYFLFVILGLYIITPYLRLVIKKNTDNQAELLFIIVLLLITCFSESFNKIVGIWRWHGTLYWVPYLGYYLMGRYIVNYAIDKRKIFAALCILGLSSNILSRYLEMVFQSETIIFFYNNMYSSITVMSLSIGIFGLIAYLAKEISESSHLVKVCRLLAPGTFGVYLVHVLIIREVEFSFHVQYPSNIIMASIYTGLLSTFSLLLVYLMGCVPLMRTIIGCHTQKILEENKINIFKSKTNLFN